jgi:hypothetical protein
MTEIFKKAILAVTSSRERYTKLSHPSYIQSGWPVPDVADQNFT